MIVIRYSADEGLCLCVSTDKKKRTLVFISCSRHQALREFVMLGLLIRVRGVFDDEDNDGEKREL